MLSEYLNDSGAAVWTQVMPGARACVFSLGEGAASLPLRLEALHFEALFCLAGSVTLTRRDGRVLKPGPRQVLLTRQPFRQSENAPTAAASSSIITCHRRVILASKFCLPPALA